MTKQTRQHFSAEHEEQPVARLSESDATHGSVAADLGVTSTQLKTWRLELETAGSATVITTQQARPPSLRCFAGTTSG